MKNKILYQLYRFYDNVLYSKSIFGNVERAGMHIHIILIYSIFTSVLFLNVPFTFIYSYYSDTFPLYPNGIMTLIYSLYSLYTIDLKAVSESKPLFFNNEPLSVFIVIVYFSISIWFMF